MFTSQQPLLIMICWPVSSKLYTSKLPLHLQMIHLTPCSSPSLPPSLPTYNIKCLFSYLNRYLASLYFGTIFHIWYMNGEKESYRQKKSERTFFAFKVSHTIFSRYYVVKHYVVCTVLFVLHNMQWWKIHKHYLHTCTILRYF